MPGEESQDGKAILAVLAHLLSAMALTCSAWHAEFMNFLPYVAGVVIGAALFGSFGKSLLCDVLSGTCVFLRRKSSISSQSSDVCIMQEHVLAQ